MGERHSVDTLGLLRYAFDSWNYRRPINLQLGISQGDFDSIVYLVTQRARNEQKQMIEGSSQHGGWVGFPDGLAEPAREPCYPQLRADVTARNLVTSPGNERPPNVYAFATNGENLPRWASGLGQSVRRVGGDWVAEGPLGQIKVQFTAPNDFGVVDHDVTFPSGVTVHNAMRVVPNGPGSTVIFTLLRPPGTSEAQFNDDAQWVEKDLTSPKELLEQSR